MYLLNNLLRKSFKDQVFQSRAGNHSFIVEGLEDAVEAVRRVAQLSRKRCREVFEQRFTATRMAHDYVQQFERLIARNQEVSEAA